MPKIPTHLYLIHFMLMLSPAALALVIHFAVLPGERGEAMPKEQIGIFQTVAAALAVVAVGMSQLIPRFMTRSSAGHKTSGVQIMPLRKFSTMKIVQWSMLEGAALFIAGVFYMTRQQGMLMPLGILIALLALMRPTQYEMERYNVKETA
ncbi:MAG: hypothetical protein U1F27_14210 [Turneriella sp.]